MAESDGKKHDDQKSSGSKRLTREEYDRLVKGCDDHFFGGLDEPTDVKSPSPEKSADEEPKDGDEAK